MHDSDIIVERDVGVAILRKRRDSILELLPKKGITHGEFQDIVTIYETFLEIQDGKKSPIYADNRNTLKITNEQKEFMKNSFHHFTTASASLIEAPMLRFMHTIFINLYKPKVPIKSFSNKKAAIKWLKQFITEEEKELYFKEEYKSLGNS